VSRAIYEAATFEDPPGQGKFVQPSQAAKDR
jgi:hypothetical protein